MGEFLVHWMVLRILDDHFCLEHLDADGGEQDALPDGKQGSLFERRVLHCPVPEREHQVVGHSVQEDAHAVGIERVAGEPVAPVYGATCRFSSFQSPGAQDKG